MPYFYINMRSWSFFVSDTEMFNCNNKNGLKALFYLQSKVLSECTTKSTEKKLQRNPMCCNTLEGMKMSTFQFETFSGRKQCSALTERQNSRNSNRKINAHSEDAQVQLLQFKRESLFTSTRSQISFVPDLLWKLLPSQQTSLVLFMWY